MPRRSAQDLTRAVITEVEVRVGNTAAFCRQHGVSRSKLVQAKGGRHDLSMGSLLELAIALNTTPSQLLLAAERRLSAEGTPCHVG